MTPSWLRTPCREADILNLSPPDPEAATIEFGGTYKRLMNVPLHLARSCVDFPTVKLREAEHKRSGAVFLLNDEDTLHFRDPTWFESPENSETSFSSSDETSEDDEGEPGDKGTQASRTSSEAPSSLSSHRSGDKSNFKDLYKLVDGSNSGQEATPKQVKKAGVLFQAAHNAAIDMTA